MSVLVVGGDRLGKIPQRLESCGFDLVDHISGRKNNKCQLCKKADMVLVLTDYVNHNLCECVKEQAKARDMNTLFCRRSWAHIYKKLSLRGYID